MREIGWDRVTAESALYALMLVSLARVPEHISPSVAHGLDDAVELRVGATSAIVYSRAARKTHDANMVGQVELLVRQSERRVPSGQPLDGRLEAEEAPLLDFGGELARDAACERCLVDNHEAASLVDRLDDGLDLLATSGESAGVSGKRKEGAHVVRHHRPQVDQFDAQAPQVLRDELLKVLVRLAKVVQRRLDRVERRAVRDDREVLAFLEDLGLAKRELKVGRRNVLDGGAVEDLRLEEELVGGGAKCELKLRSAGQKSSDAGASSSHGRRELTTGLGSRMAAVGVGRTVSPNLRR